MSTQARDFIELLQEDPQSPELRRLALNLIAPGVRDERVGL
jgi:hypothetical protein